MMGYTKEEKEIIIANLIKIRDNALGTDLKQKEFFVCIAIMKTYMLRQYMTYDYFKSQRPTKYLNSEFFHHRAYVKDGVAWWSYALDYPNIVGKPELIIEKKRFLTHIINKLK